ncbi:MAG: DUF4080 domain-containing protein [bacterium]|nr:DUF4080 domain-containing protein [bacterium]
MKLLLAALHSKYAHSSLALPCLASYCKEISGIDISIREFTINENPNIVLSSIIKEDARIVAFSCYIWNTGQILSIASSIKKKHPHTFIILGGPEVSFDARDILKANPFIDCIVKGEGESTFRGLVKALSVSGNKISLKELKGVSLRLGDKIIDNGPPMQISDLDEIPSPFASGLVNMSKPLIYYETSRGCPFTCAFCLSAIEGKVRSFSMDRIRCDLGYLIKNGTGTIKFVDRTFNYNAKRANEIWSFIIEKGISRKYHFEIAADLLTDENIELLKYVPEGAFRFEIGVQSIAEETLHSVGRDSDLERLFANVKRLIDETKVKIHLDLVAGLPGENFKGFLQSLERLFLLKPHHIQVEPLKVLKGAPMMAIAAKDGYRWAHLPPYRIISSPSLNEGEIEQIEAIGRLLELLYNSGRFRASLEALSSVMPLSEFFAHFALFWGKEGITTLPMEGLFDLLWRFVGGLIDMVAQELLAEALTFDRLRAGYPDLKKMPSYFTCFSERKGDDYKVSKNEVMEFRKKLGISPKSKARAIKWHFGRDYRDGIKEEAVRLTFVYISTSGLKQEIRVVT